MMKLSLKLPGRKFISDGVADTLISTLVLPGLVTLIPIRSSCLTPLKVMLPLEVRVLSSPLKVAVMLLLPAATPVKVALMITTILSASAIAASPRKLPPLSPPLVTAGVWGGVLSASAIGAPRKLSTFNPLLVTDRSGCAAFLAAFFGAALFAAAFFGANLLSADFLTAAFFFIGVFFTAFFVFRAI